MNKYERILTRNGLGSDLDAVIARIVASNGNRTEVIALLQDAAAYLFGLMRGWKLKGEFDRADIGRITLSRRSRRRLDGYGAWHGYAEHSWTNSKEGWSIALVTHPYGIRDDLPEWAASHRLDVDFLPKSQSRYYPGTTDVVVYMPV